MIGKPNAVLIEAAGQPSLAAPQWRSAPYLQVLTVGVAGETEVTV